MSELTQSVVAAGAGARDVVHDPDSITGDVDAEQTNMAARSDNVRS